MSVTKTTTIRAFIYKTPTVGYGTPIPPKIERDCSTGIFVSAPTGGSTRPVTGQLYPRGK